DLVADETQDDRQRVEVPMHVPWRREEVAHAEAEEVRPIALVQRRARRARNDSIEASEERLRQVVGADRGEVERHLHDLLQVAPASILVPGAELFSERFLDPVAVEREKIDGVREVRDEAHEPDDVPNLVATESVEIVEDDYDALPDRGERLLHLGPKRLDALLVAGE